MSENEEWRNCPLDDRYRVSNLGRVIGQKGKLISGALSQYGYPVIHKRTGQSKSVFIHRMIASAFIPNPENLCSVNHKNGIRTDNRVSNLEWISRAENIRHAATTLKSYRGEKHNRAKITASQAIEIFEKLKKPDSDYEAIGREYGVSRVAISHMARGNSWHEEREKAGYIPFSGNLRRKFRFIASEERGHVSTNC